MHGKSRVVHWAVKDIWVGERHCQYILKVNLRCQVEAGLYTWYTADAGSGSYFQPGNIANAADGSDGLYRSYHIANEFTYMLGSTNNLDPSTAYVAVLHFAGMSNSIPNIGAFRQTSSD